MNPTNQLEPSLYTQINNLLSTADWTSAIDHSWNAADKIMDIIQADHRQRAYKEFIELVGENEQEAIGDFFRTSRNQLKDQLCKAAATYYSDHNLYSKRLQPDNLVRDYCTTGDTGFGYAR